MTESRRWGEPHLGLDAMVAFVDDELAPGARRRALAHLAGCKDCAFEVVAQTQARLMLRAASVPAPPSGLLRTLRAIPSEAELPVTTAGLAVGPGGELVTMVRPPTTRSGRQRGQLDRRVRLGAGAVVSGIALGALALTATHSAAPGPDASGPALNARSQLGGAPSDAVAVSAAVSVAPSAVPRSLPSDLPKSASRRFSDTPRIAHHRWYR